MPWTLLGAALILVAGLAEAASTWLWLAALAVTYVGAASSGSVGWHLHPAHFAERHGLIVIIALGESACPGSTSERARSSPRSSGSSSRRRFWLAYFDFFSIRGEQLLEARRGEERVAFARVVYSYAHFPMIVGIVLFAFAMKTIVRHVGDELDSVAAFALCGGCSLYLLTYSAIRFRVDRRFSGGRLIAAAAFLLALPLATRISALAALGIVTIIWLGLHAYELVWWREARAESRSMIASS